MDAALDGVVFRCTVCDAKAGTCDCWTKCSCGHSFRKGDTCGNVEHVCEAIAGDLSAMILQKIGQKRKAGRPISLLMVERAAYECGLDWARLICKPPETLYPPPVPAQSKIIGG